MSNALGATAKQKNVAASLRYQTSQAGGVIPIVYGTTKLAPNLLNYTDFVASQESASKGKGSGITGKGTGQETYTASIILGICQGPVAGFGLVWWNKNLSYADAVPGLSSLNFGADGQAADSYWAANYADTALGYSGTSNIVFDNYQLGASAALPNFNLEMYGIAGASGPNGYDAVPAAIVIDFLTNARYGANFPAANLDSLTSWSEYTNAAGIFLSPALTTQQAASQLLTMAAQLTNSAVVWSGGLLKILPYGDQPLNASYYLVTIGGAVAELDTISLTFTSSGLSGSPVTITYQVPYTGADTVSYTAVGRGLAYAMSGNAALAAAGILGGPSPQGMMIAVTVPATLPLSISGSGSGGETFAFSGQIGPFAFTPNTTPVYSLAEDDYIVQESSVGVYLGVTPGSSALRMGATPITGGFTDDPVHVTRSTPADANNWVELECLDRGNGYNPSPVIQFDQGSIDLYGVRKESSVSAHAIVDPYLTGPIVAQLILQRSLYYRNTYTFNLGWKYILLEPMDLVQITDPYLGVDHLTVRITSVAEDEEGTLAITAEDFFGTAGAVLYPPEGYYYNPNQPTQSLGQGAGTATPRAGQAGSSSSSTPVYNSAAPSVNVPFLLEAPAQLLAAQGQTSPQLIIGLSGGPASAGWGGADINVSLDDATYGQPFASHPVVGPATMGVTTADLPLFSGSNPDTTDTLSVNLAESGGTLASVSAGNAAALVTLCAIQNSGGALELMAFETATLVSGNAYNLTTLYRGLYGTTAIDHPSGAQFLFLGDGKYWHDTLPSQYVGVDVWFKFQSFNQTGGGLQELSAATAYEYLITGGGIGPGSSSAYPVYSVQVINTNSNVTL